MDREIKSWADLKNKKGQLECPYCGQTWKRHTRMVVLLDHLKDSHGKRLNPGQGLTDVSDPVFDESHFAGLLAVQPSRNAADFDLARGLPVCRVRREGGRTIYTLR